MATARKRRAGAVRSRKPKKAAVKKTKTKAKAKDDAPPPPPADVGKVGWLDITVPDAPKLRDFYKRVVGWSSTPVEMGGYEDYSMVPPNSTDGVAGICHARGNNVGLPNAWLPYFHVADIEASARQVEVLGGRLRTPIRSMGSMGRYVVIEDVAGAVCALFQSAPQD